MYSPSTLFIGLRCLTSELTSDGGGLPSSMLLELQLPRKSASTAPDTRERQLVAVRNARPSTMPVVRGLNIPGEMALRAASEMIPGDAVEQGQHCGCVEAGFVDVKSRITYPAATTDRPASVVVRCVRCCICWYNSIV